MARLNRIAFVIVATSVLMCVLAEELEVYPSEIDDLDIPKILANEAVRQGYVDCFLKTAPCTEKQKLHTDVYRDAIKTKCKKCSEKLNEDLKIVAEWYEKNKPDTWKLLLANANS